MAATELEIINMALDHLDEEFAIADNDQRPSVLILTRNFAQTRDALLVRHPWNFAVESQNLTTSTTSTAGWDYTFAIPAEVLRILPLQVRGRAGGQPIMHERRGSLLYVNAGDPLQVRYIKRVTDVTLFSPLFVEVLALALALRVAHAITHKQSYVDRLTAAYDRAMADAQRIDSLEGSAEAPLGEDWETARITGL